MLELYHYTSHSSLKEIEESGHIAPSPGFHNRTGVWLTGLAPEEHSKEEILWNNYKYEDGEVSRKLYRAACWVRVHVPSSQVEDISHPHNHPEQDVWIWPDQNLILGDFPHQFGVMVGTEDTILKGRIMATSQRAFRASSIRKRMGEIGTDQGRKSVLDFFTQIMENSFFKYDDDDPFVEIQEVGLAVCDLYLKHTSMG